MFVPNFRLGFPSLPLMPGNSYQRAFCNRVPLTPLKHMATLPPPLLHSLWTVACLTGGTGTGVGVGVVGQAETRRLQRTCGRRNHRSGIMAHYRALNVSHCCDGTQGNCTDACDRACFKLSLKWFSRMFLPHFLGRVWGFLHVKALQTPLQWRLNRYPRSCLYEFMLLYLVTLMWNNFLIVKYVFVLCASVDVFLAVRSSINLNRLRLSGGFLSPTWSLCTCAWVSGDGSVYTCRGAACLFSSSTACAAFPPGHRKHLRRGDGFFLLEQPGAS